MIEYIEFENYRNLNGRYDFKAPFTTIVGKNSSGKTNILDGIRYAFCALSGEYYKVDKTDFSNSDDDLQIVIRVALNEGAIPSLSYIDSDGTMKYGFSLTIKKTSSGRYKKEICLFNGEPVDWDILSEDQAIPNIYSVPLTRTDTVYGDGLAFNLADFIESEEAYRDIKEASKEQLKQQMGDKIDQFKSLCEKFNHGLDVDITDPILSNEKLYIFEGNKEHGVKIGSGYKSIANILLHTFNDKHNIILIDEIENHIHPSLLRTFLRELREIKNLTIIATTHSPVVTNECKIEEIMDVSGKRLDELEVDVVNRLNLFLHPGRGEIIFADNVVLVEGYTEEMLLRNYLNTKSNYNWTIINVAGVMFKPYIALARLLDKVVVVISDNDKKTNQDVSTRFRKLKNYCDNNGVKLIEVENTLESDLVKGGIIDAEKGNLLRKLEGSDYYVAKDNHAKTTMVQNMINDNVDLSNWHIIKELSDEFADN